MPETSGAMRLTRASAPILAALLMLAARLLLAAPLLLAGCDADTTATTTAATTPPHPRIPIQRFLPEPAPPEPPPPTPAPGAPAPADNAAAGQPPERENDPSAPLDTPLCGRAEREAIAASTAVSPEVIPAAGACAETACFDPLTDTYIGADGARHVCQE